MYPGGGAGYHRSAGERSRGRKPGQEAMSITTELDSLDLAALVASRVCHDVISPVGAIVNGLEVLEDENDASMRDFALDLIRKSARQASARLQFARLAFGAAGTAGSQLDTGDAEQVTRGLLEDSKTQIQWTVPRLILPKSKVKLLMNLVIVAMATIPRGGTILVKANSAEGQDGFELKATGPASRIPPDLPELLLGNAPNGRVDSHVIQPFYTGLVAREAGMVVRFVTDGETVTVSAVPIG